MGIIILIVVAVIGTNINKKNKISYKYGNEVIEILTYYKENKLEAKDAATQLDKLRREIEEEINKINDNYDKEAHRLNTIRFKCDYAYIQLNGYKTMSLLDINKTIEEIKEQIK